MTLNATIITPSSKDEIKKYYQIRFEELRKPWSQPIGSEQDSIEDSCIHRMIRLGDEYAGVARLQYNTDLQAQIMALMCLADGDSQI